MDPWIDPRLPDESADPSWLGGLAAGTMVGAGGGRNDGTGVRVTTLVSPHEKVKGR
jgi:hypothetical protein